MSIREVVAITLIIFIAGVGLSVVADGDVDDEYRITPVGTFPDRSSLEDLDSYQQALEYYEEKNPGQFSSEDIEKIIAGKPSNFGKESISTSFLDNSLGGVPAAYYGTGAANVVTGILWDYRGYDTLGEATVIFVAVAAVAALFRMSKKEEEE